MPILSKVTISPEEKHRRRIICSIVALLLTIAFTAGFFTVYVRSYNIMHKEPMVVFSVYETKDGYSVVVFNHRFDFDVDE